MIYRSFSNNFTVRRLEIIPIISYRRRKIWRGIYILIRLTAIFTLFLALLDNIAEIKEAIDDLACLAENIRRRIDVVLWHFHPSENYRHEKQQQYRKYDADDHESDAIPSFLFVFFLAVGENKKDDCADKCIDTSHDNQDNDQGQNSQDDILEISIGIHCVHDRKSKRIKNGLIISSPLSWLLLFFPCVRWTYWKGRS